MDCRDVITESRHERFGLLALPIPSIAASAKPAQRPAEPVQVTFGHAKGIVSVLAVFDLGVRIKNDLAKTRQDQIAPPIMDQDLDLTLAYVMNKMRVGIVGDTRGFEFALGAVTAAMA